MPLAVESIANETVAAVLRGFFEPAGLTPMRPMTEELTGMMARLAILPDAAAEKAWRASVGRDVFTTRVIESIAGHSRRGVSARVRTFVGIVSRSPADVTMYLSYAVWAAREAGRDRVDFDGFVDTFHSGFWSPEDRDRLWQGQKVDVKIDVGGVARAVNGLDALEVLDWLDSEKPAGARISDRTPSEHVASCKERALAVLAAGDVTGAFSAMAAGLRRHDGTRDHPGLTLGMGELIGGHLDNPDRMRRWIEGFR